MRLSRVLSSRAVLGGLAIVGGAAVTLSPIGASLGLACPSGITKEAVVTMDLGGGKTAPIMVRLIDFEEADVAEADRPEGACHAALEASLSAFPSIESRYTTGRIADAIAETVAAWDVTDCTVYTVYDNDVEAEFAPHHLCRSARYAFDDDRVRSLGSEVYCWEPDPETEALAATH